MNRVDGLTRTHRLAIAKKSLRWNTGQNNLKQQCIDTVEDILNDHTAPQFMKLKAVDIIVKMEQQNMIDERMEAAEGDLDGPQVVLVLPANGSEVEA